MNIPNHPSSFEVDDGSRSRRIAYQGPTDVVSGNFFQSFFLLIFGHHRIDKTFSECSSISSAVPHIFPEIHGDFMGQFLVPAGRSQLGPMFPLFRQHQAAIHVVVEIPRHDGFLGWVIVDTYIIYRIL